MLHVLIAEGRYDRGFVERFTHGFGELAAYVAAFTPERVEAITGVPADTVRELARAVASSKGCAILMYTGLEYSNSGVQAIRAVLTLQAITGHLDSPGGKLIRPRDRVRLHRNVTLAPTGGRPAIGSAEYPLFHAMRQEAHAALLPRAILDGEPYPVRGLIVSGASILTAWPEPARWRKALAALDLLVTIDRFPTADAAYADLVLPATTMFEIESYMEYGGRVELRRRVVEPVGEARNDYLVFAELASRLGYGERWPQTERAMIELALEGTGITYDQLACEPRRRRAARARSRRSASTRPGDCGATAHRASRRRRVASRSPPSCFVHTATSRCRSTPSRWRAPSPTRSSHVASRWCSARVPARSRTSAPSTATSPRSSRCSPGRSFTSTRPTRPTVGSRTATRSTWSRGAARCGSGRT